tara:strand:- start:262 stop:717 length:456 start_codon:yes stop_codon:yes gene_type:complete
MTKEQINQIIQDNIRDIATKSTLGYNGYYQNITWEIDENGDLYDHWLGGQSTIKQEETSIYFHTNIDQDTSYLLENSYITKGEWYEEEKYIHPEMEIYKAKLTDENICDSEGKILDIDSYKEFLFDEFWIQESCEYYLERIKEQINNSNNQ